jgi:hypothetical protein
MRDLRATFAILLRASNGVFAGYVLPRDCCAHHMRMSYARDVFFWLGL